MRCTKCKLQYVGIANTEFNFQINNHRKDILKSNAIPSVRQLAHKDHHFNTDAKITNIEHIQNKNFNNEDIKERLKQC